MNNELKSKIKASMLAHLQSKGYPDNLNNNQVMQEIPNLWTKLAKEGLLTELIEKGLTYQHFEGIANQEKQKSDTMDLMANFFKNRG